MLPRQTKVGAGFMVDSGWKAQGGKRCCDQALIVQSAAGQIGFPVLTTTTGSLASLQGARLVIHWRHPTSGWLREPVRSCSRPCRNGVSERFHSHRFGPSPGRLKQPAGWLLRAPQAPRPFEHKSCSEARAAASAHTLAPHSSARGLLLKRPSPRTSPIPARTPDRPRPSLRSCIDQDWRAAGATDWLANLDQALTAATKPLLGVKRKNSIRHPRLSRVCLALRASVASSKCFSARAGSLNRCNQSGQSPCGAWMSS